MLNNLYGVDIMEEATEICKLRLFLKLVAQVTPNHSLPNYGIEPLPDIDFNIRAGNSLVGFANYDQVKKAVEGSQQLKLDLFSDMTRIDEKAKRVSQVYQTFRDIQTSTVNGSDFTGTKQLLQESLDSLNEELNEYLAREYGIDVQKKQEWEKWKLSHCPFHWFVEFYGIISRGGFDVIIGNPPYVEYSKLNYSISSNNYKVNFKPDIYAAIIERSICIIKKQGKLSMIVPVSIFSTKGFVSLQKFIIDNFNNIWISNFADSCKLFQGITKRLTIIILSNHQKSAFYQTKYYKEKYNSDLFKIIKYQKLEKLYYTVEGSIPKIFDSIEKSILNKVFNDKNQLIQNCQSQEGKSLYFTRTLRNFCLFHHEKPYRLDKDNNKVYASEIIEVKYYQYLYWLILSIFNSNLFVWFYNLFSDMRHINKGINELFMIPQERNKTTVNQHLQQLILSLMNSYEDNVQIKKANSSGIRERYYQPRLSKPIIDEIDKILAEHYGFTEAELDFIINYDIKYRMGKELEEDDN
jgi:hypothetical protein